MVNYSFHIKTDYLEKIDTLKKRMPSTSTDYFTVGI
jgi:hypothetical protein